MKASPVPPDSGATSQKDSRQARQVLQNAEVFISSRTCKWGESGESLRSRSPLGRSEVSSKVAAYSCSRTPFRASVRIADYPEYSLIIRQG